MTGSAHAWQPALPDGTGEVIRCRGEALCAALKLDVAERELGGKESATAALQQAENRLYLAARALAAAVDALPLDRKPKGWGS